MKYLGIFLCVLTISIILSTCTKSEQDIPTELYKSIITLSNEHKIQNVDNYKFDSLDYSIEFYYGNNLVEIVRTFPKINIKAISNYFLNEAGFADSCITSTYYSDKLKYIHISKYDYYDSYKKKAKIIVDTYDSDIITSTSYATLIYSIKNGNTVFENINGICSNYFKFNDLENIIDIDDFIGDFNGKINKNLLGSSYTDCPDSHHHSEYEYTIDANGYVIERVEHYYTSGGSDTNEVKKITQFEYKFQ